MQPGRSDGIAPDWHEPSRLHLIPNYSLSVCCRTDAKTRTRDPDADGGPTDRMHGFGYVTAAARRSAELFFAALVAVGRNGLYSHHFFVAEVAHEITS